MSSIKYRPEIDGLRAFAVIPVVMFHLSAEWMPGGFIGVDVFFVISGFLITKLILEEYDQGIFSFPNFWLRRIRRIVPALLTMIIMTSIAGYSILYGPDINDLGKQGIASLLSFANVYFWRLKGNYWGPQAEDSSFLHTWSLSVEEQFYLFFPFLLIFLIKFYKKYLVPSIAFLAIISFLLFLYGSRKYPTATFYLLPTRAWELGSGCLLAILTYKNQLQKYNVLKPENSNLLASIGLLTILLSYTFISGKEGISAYLIIPVIGSVFIIAFSKDKASIVNRILTVFPVVYIGKISYSLYIWHWPVFFLQKNFYLNGKIAFTHLYSIPFLFAISIASYHLIEQPTRQKHNIILPILVSFLAIMTFSLFLSISNVAEDITIYSETTWNGNLYNVAPNQEWSDFTKKRMEGITVPIREVLNHNSYSEGGIIKIYNKEIPEVVIIGDSHALMWSGILDDILKELGVSASFYVADGDPTFFNIPVIKQTEMSLFFSSEEKYIFDKMRLHFLEKWKPKVVVIAVRWPKIENLQMTQDLIEYLAKIGSKVLLLEQPPELFFGDKNAPQYLSHMNILPIKNTNKYIPKNNSLEYNKGLNLIRKISEKYAHCELIEITDIFTNKNEVWVLDGYDVLYIDDDHLSYKGALKAKSRIKQILQRYFLFY